MPIRRSSANHSLRGRQRVISHRFVVPRYSFFTSNHSLPKSTFCRPAHSKIVFFTPELGKSLLGLRIACFLGRARACVRWEERRCEKTEAAIKQGIAAPDWPRYGTRPPLRYLCVLPAVRAAGGGFRRRRGALCACRCTLGRLFGLTYAARPRAWRYALAQ